MKLGQWIILFPLFLIFGGCASFPKGRLEGVEIPSLDASHSAEKVAIEVKFFVGDPDAGVAESNFRAIPTHKAVIEQVISESKLFSEYTFDQITGANYPYKLKLIFFNDFSRGAAFTFGFLSGATLGVLPVGGSEEFTLKASLTHNAQPGTSVRAQDGVLNLVGLVFLPLAGNTPEHAHSVTVARLVRDALRQLIESGAFVSPDLPSNLH